MDKPVVTFSRARLYKDVRGNLRVAAEIGSSEFVDLLVTKYDDVMKTIETAQVVLYGQREGASPL